MAKICSYPVEDLGGEPLGHSPPPVIPKNTAEKYNP